MTTEQIALLNSFMYFDELVLDEGKTIAQCIEEMYVNRRDEYEEMLKDYETTLGEGGAEKIIDAIIADEELSNLKVKNSTKDNDYENDGRPVMACFANDETKEAIVAYRGSNLVEWMDNADGLLHESSVLQREARVFFEESAKILGDEYEIDVTGHSKGGNKAQYVTIMDDRVRNCYSFNGQGFSKEFCEINGEKIEENVHKITSYGSCDDIVHGLGNIISQNNVAFKTNGIDSVLDKSFENIAKAHFSDAYFQIDEDGNVIMNEQTQESELTKVINQATEGMTNLPDNVQEAVYTNIMGICQITLGEGVEPVGIYDTPEHIEAIKAISEYTVDDVMNMAKEFISKNEKDALEWGKNKADEIAEGIKEFAENPTDWISDRVDDATDWGSDRVDDIKELAGNAKDWGSDRMDDIREFTDGFGDWVEDKFGMEKDLSAGKNDSIGAMINEAIQEGERIASSDMDRNYDYAMGLG